MAEGDFEEFMKNLGLIVRRLRKERDLTQGELGEKLGKPQSTIARLESSVVKDTHIGLLYEVCDNLDVKLADVIAEAFGRTLVSRAADKKSINGKLELLREKILLLDGDQKKAVVKILDGIFELV